MAEPVDAVKAIHNAFRNDIVRIDAAALESAKGKKGLATTIERFRFLNEVLVWHARGEESAVFPVIENIAPLATETYIKDHRGLDAAYDELKASYSALDPIKTARATAVFRFHLTMHLDKEDTHLYRIFKERISLPEQGKAMGIMSGTVPQERFAELVAWLYPLIGHDDRENMTRIWQIVMPVPVFSGVKELIRKAIGSDWAELSRRIPTL
jgi:hypothetical protein